ncbi:hypothetical protein [Pedobacter nanyangensis]|uniref:hypothetical protein n=1 Tax=Pedobacter nanyangensis TaxID=1562389 RepID=UPI0013B3EF0E|nr:hypothetical protein [Pedobacter nanyangensis]
MRGLTTSSWRGRQLQPTYNYSQPMKLKLHSRKDGTKANISPFLFAQHAQSA